MIIFIYKLALERTRLEAFMRMCVRFCRDGKGEIEIQIDCAARISTL